MLLIGLLLLALIFVVVGVVRASVGWLIASLVVSVLAAAVLLRSYFQTRKAGSEARSVSSAPADAPRSQQAPAAARAPVAVTGKGQGAVPANTLVWVVDGYPEYHVAGCTELDGLPAEAVPYEQAVEDGFQPCVVCNPDRALPGRSHAAAGRSHTDAVGAAPAARPDSRQVLVIDGLPHYHVAGCRLLLAHDSVSIPIEQAVEDGFSPCDVCDPDAAGASTDVRPTHGRDVWVVDGYPDYHRAGCAALAGLSPEAIPYEQAVEDGFAECPVCTPGSEHAPGHATSAAAALVWVVDGFPDYHRAHCGELGGLPAEAIPLEQAVEDGFAPCPLCQPKIRPEAEPAAEGDNRQVCVVDGYPDYHREGCDEVNGLPTEVIPHEQAVEDGFAPCPVCRPAADLQQ